MKKLVLIALFALGSMTASERLDRCPEFQQWVSEQILEGKPKEVILEEARRMLEDHIQNGYISENIEEVLEEAATYLESAFSNRE